MERLKHHLILRRKAALDLAAARMLLRPGEDEPLAEAALFHLQQAAEKLVKSLLSRQGIHYPKTHDIENLLQLCRQNNIALPENADRLVDLSDYAVESRYEMMSEPVAGIAGYLDQVDALQQFVEQEQ